MSCGHAMAKLKVFRPAYITKVFVVIFLNRATVIGPVNFTRLIDIIW